MAKKGTKVISGKSSGAAGTRPVARTNGYAAVRAGFSPARQSATATIAPARKSATATISAPKKASTNMAAAKSAPRKAVSKPGPNLAATRNFASATIRKKK